MSSRVTISGDGLDNVGGDGTRSNLSTNQRRQRSRYRIIINFILFSHFFFPFLGYFYKLNLKLPVPGESAPKIKIQIWKALIPTVRRTSTESKSDQATKK